MTVGLRARQCDVPLNHANAHGACLRLVRQRYRRRGNDKRARAQRQERPRETALRADGTIAPGARTAQENGDKDDGGRNEARPADGREMPEWGIHLRQGHRAPREARPRPARARGVDPRPADRIQERLRERRASRAPQARPPDEHDPGAQEQRLHEGKHEPCRPRSHRHGDPVDERQPHAHAEGQGHAKRPGGPGLVDAGDEQCERRDRHPPPPQRRKRRVQSQPGHRPDHGVRARLCDGRAAQYLRSPHATLPAR